MTPAASAPYFWKVRPMTTRRRFLKLATGGAGVYLTSKLGLWPRALAQIPGGTLPPEVIRKFVTPLVIPPAMPLNIGSSSTARPPRAVV